MYSKAVLLLAFAVVRGLAAGDTTSVGPLLTCDLTTFSCPGTSGCCPIGGCCGSGCCTLGYTCINEGTADETCCEANDATKCGTVSPDSSPDDSNSGSNNCLGIDNCPRDPVRGLAWTCLLGKTCGFSYGECFPCERTGGGSTGDDSTGGGSNGGGSSDDASDTTTSVDAAVTSTSPDDSPSTSSDESSNDASTTSGSDSSSASSSDEPGVGTQIGRSSVLLAALGLAVGFFVVL